MSFKKVQNNIRCFTTSTIFLCTLNTSSFVLNVAQNEKKYLRPMTTYKLDFVKPPDVHPDVQVHRSTELYATCLPTSIIFGRGHMRRKDEDLITW